MELEVEEVANAYSKTILGTLLYDLMGFTGYVNDDSGVINGGKQFGMEEYSIPERYAASINAGSDTGADGGALFMWKYSTTTWCTIPPGGITPCGADSAT